MPVVDVRRTLRRTIVDGRFVHQRGVGNLGDDPPVISDAKQAVGGDLANVRGVQVPFVEDALDFGFASLLHHQEHPLLRFGQHDLVGRHAGLTLRYTGDIDLDAGAPARPHLARRTRQAGGTHVLHADQRVGLHQLETGLEQQLLHEGVADLHGRALLGRSFVELRRRHRRAMDAVASGLCADVVDGVADSRGAALDQRAGLGDAQAQHVHQRIAGIHIVEGNLSADGGNPDAVAVAANTRDDARDDPPSAGAVRSVEAAKPERIPQRNRTRAHREDVTDDSADAGRRPLVGLDERRVVVRLDLEDRGQAVADVHRAGVLPRTLQHAWPLGGQLLQMNSRALVAAVLRPHHRENPELGLGRLPVQRADDAVVFLAGQAVPIENLLVDAHARNTQPVESNMLIMLSVPPLPAPAP